MSICTGGFHKDISVLWIFFVRQTRQIQRYGNQALSSNEGNGNEKSLEINMWEMLTILWLLLLPRILYCWQSTLEMDWKRSAVEVNIEDDRFTVVCSRQVVFKTLIGSLGTRVFETRTATGRGHSVCQDSGVSHIFMLIIHNREKVLSIVNVMCEEEL